MFEHLDDLSAMGVNCMELLPTEDSPQTLNWGYGTRFFFAPDYDVGHGIVGGRRVLVAGLGQERRAPAPSWKVVTGKCRRLLFYTALRNFA